MTWRTRSSREEIYFLFVNNKTINQAIKMSPKPRRWNLTLSADEGTYSIGRRGKSLYQQGSLRQNNAQNQKENKTKTKTTFGAQKLPNQNKSQILFTENPKPKPLLLDIRFWFWFSTGEIWFWFWFVALVSELKPTPKPDLVHRNFKTTTSFLEIRFWFWLRCWFGFGFCFYFSQKLHSGNPLFVSYCPCIFVCELLSLDFVCELLSLYFLCELLSLDFMWASVPIFVYVSYCP